MLPRYCKRHGHMAEGVPTTTTSVNGRSVARFQNNFHVNFTFSGGVGVPKRFLFREVDKRKKKRNSVV